MKILRNPIFMFTLGAMKYYFVHTTTNNTITVSSSTAQILSRTITKLGK